jgi:hypothetical protein
LLQLTAGIRPSPGRHHLILAMMNPSRGSLTNVRPSAQPGSDDLIVASLQVSHHSLALAHGGQYGVAAA